MGQLPWRALSECYYQGTNSEKSTSGFQGLLKRQAFAYHVIA